MPEVYILSVEYKIFIQDFLIGPTNSSIAVQFHFIKEKYFLLFCLFFSLSSKIKAQEKACVGILIGPSFPAGEFASMDGQNDKAGFAKTGAIFDLSFSFPMKGEVGITALIRGQANAMDGEKLIDVVRARFPSAAWKSESGYWSTSAVLAGPHVSLPLAKKTFFNVRVLFGFTSCFLPEYKITGKLPTYEFWVKQERKSAVALGALFGFGLRSEISPKLCFILNCDYLTTAPVFSDVKITSSEAIGNSNSKFQNNINTINLGLGIGFMFR